MSFSELALVTLAAIGFVATLRLLLEELLKLWPLIHRHLEEWRRL